MSVRGFDRFGERKSDEMHPDADKLYVEEIDLREVEAPRTICSGLVPFMKEEDILGKRDCGGKLKGEEHARGEVARHVISGLERDAR